MASRTLHRRPTHTNESTMMSWPIPQWLFTQMLTEPARPHAVALRTQAAAAIEPSTNRGARDRQPLRRCRPRSPRRAGLQRVGADYLADARRSTNAEKLAAVRQALRQHGRAIVDGQTGDVEYRAAMTTSVR